MKILTFYNKHNSDAKIIFLAKIEQKFFLLCDNFGNKVFVFSPEVDASLFFLCAISTWASLLQALYKPTQVAARCWHSA